MKVTLLSENLQKKLSFANKAISSRNQLPILSHVLLETRGEKLVISSTDLEIGVETACAASVEEEGAITVHAKVFLELINSLPQGKITLETKNQSIEITGKSSRTILQTTPKDEFPICYEQKGDKIAVFPKGGMKQTLGRILFSSSIESTRPALSGVLFQNKDKKTLVVGTDGYRLSLDEIESQGEESFDKLLIPARILREALSIFDDEETVVYLSSITNQIVFEQGETILVGRTIEAEFPQYEKVIPTDSASITKIDREELLKAVKICAIFARESANIITLSLLSDKMIVSAKSPSLGENTVDVQAQMTGEENQIAFNAKYLLEALSNIPDDELTFSMTGPLNPGVFRVQGNTHFLHLIMPIRV